MAGLEQSSNPSAPPPSYHSLFGDDAPSGITSPPEVTSSGTILSSQASLPPVNTPLRAPSSHPTSRPPTSSPVRTSQQDSTGRSGRVLLSDVSRDFRRETPAVSPSALSSNPAALEYLNTFHFESLIVGDLLVPVRVKGFLPVGWVPGHNDLAFDIHFHEHPKYSVGRNSDFYVQLEDGVAKRIKYEPVDHDDEVECCVIL